VALSFPANGGTYNAGGRLERRLPERRGRLRESK